MQWYGKGWNDILEDEEQRINKKTKKEIVPDWVGQEIKKVPLTEEEQKEMDELMSRFQ